MSTDLWQTAKLDLDAYLARVGIPDVPPANDATLARLHEAHVTTIPFENLDPVLGRPASLEVGDIQRKLVDTPRGGYCYEHTLLFAAVLERLGFGVARLLARVFPHSSNPMMSLRTHMTLAVYTDSGTWLSDVGFGTSALAPIRLADGATSQRGGWTHRIAHEADRWTLFEELADGPVAWHSFTLEPQLPIDYAVVNHYIATHPDSPFSTRPVAFRNAPTVRYRLHDTQLTTNWADGSTQVRHVSRAELPEVLREVFGIEPAPDDLERLRNLPAFEEKS